MIRDGGIGTGASVTTARDPFIARLPLHYGWIILASGAIGAFMTLPGQTNGVSLFFDPAMADLGLTRVEVALAYTVGTLAGTLPEPLIGRWNGIRGSAR